MRTMAATVVFGLLLASCASSETAPGPKPPEQEKKTTVRHYGTLRITGNEPFTDLVLTVEGRDYLVVGPAEELLRHRQGATVAIEGTPCVSPKPDYTLCIEATGPVQ